MFSQAYYKSSFDFDNSINAQMRVLGDRETPKIIGMETNAFENFDTGRDLIEKLQEYEPSLTAACIHQEVDDDDMNLRITYYPGHIDKRFVERVRFIPLSGREFFTLVSIPASCWKVNQDTASLGAYEQWISALPESEANLVRTFRNRFDDDARKFMKDTSVKSLIFWNKLGSMLEFPSATCFHGTIIPAGRREKSCRVYRDLLILHPFVLEYI